MKAIIILSWLFLMTLSSCTNKMALNENSVPKTLLIGVYVGEGPEATLDRMKLTQEYLSAKLQIPVEIVKATDYTAVIEALRANKVHMAYLPPFAYVLAAEKIKIDVLVTLGVNGKPSNYQSMIVASKGSGVKTMEDLKARSKDLTLGFSDPASASGHLIPHAYLNSIGLPPETSFKDILFASGHTAAIMSVKSGKIDVGCTGLLMKKILTKKGLINDDDVVVLWTSDPIVTDPVVIRSDINKQFADKIRQAYLDVSTEAPEVLRHYLKNVYDSEKIDSLDYIVAHDSLYNGIRKLASGLTSIESLQ
jgi:phosphonate transport system substrate-binding protein